jgi:two-component sensor histidine kinase
VKYGALSADTGTLDVSGSTTGSDLELVWVERGGPRVQPPAAADGYGSKLIQRSVSGHLGGTIDYQWSPEERIAADLGRLGVQPAISSWLTHR